MSEFIKIIYLNETGEMEYLFKLIYTDSDMRCHVSALTWAQHPIHFSMRQQGDSWRIVNAPEPPNWIIKAEEYFSNAVRQYLNSV